MTFCLCQRSPEFYRMRMRNDTSFSSSDCTRTKEEIIFRILFFLMHGLQVSCVWPEESLLIQKFERIYMKPWLRISKALSQSVP